MAPAGRATIDEVAPRARASALHIGGSGPMESAASRAISEGVSRQAGPRACRGGGRDGGFTGRTPKARSSLNTQKMLHF